MDLLTFRTSLINDVNLRTTQGVFHSQAFADYAGDLLVQGEELSSYNPCYAKFVGERNRIITIDGYEWDEDDDSYRIIIGCYFGETIEQTVTKTTAQTEFKKAMAFVEHAASGWIGQNVQPASDHYRLAMEIKSACERNAIARFRFFLVTDGVMSDRIRDWPEGSIAGIQSDFRIWDASRFLALQESKSGTEPVVVDFSHCLRGGLPLLTTASEHESYRGYLCLIPGEILAEVYDTYGSRLLEGNVRSFLSARGKVNKGISKTIKNEPGMFFAFNNGIAVTASAVTINENQSGEKVITSATNFQIVNGGQTTASLSTTRRKDGADLSNVTVAMKLSVVAEEVAAEITPSISRYANSQNKISDADLLSNHPLHRRIEQLSNSLMAPSRSNQQYGTYWFYERARGQYLAEINRHIKASARTNFETSRPKSQVVTKELLARVENAWSQYPNRVSMGGQKNFARFAEDAAKLWESNQDSFHEGFFKRVTVKLMLIREAESIAIRLEHKTIKAHIANYCVACCSKMLSDVERDLDWEAFWRKQDVTPEWSDQLEAIIRVIAPIMTKTDHDSMIITEWFKKELLWTRMKDGIQNLQLSPNVQTITLKESKMIKREQRDTQVVVGSVADITKVMEIGQSGWARLRRWEPAKRLFSPEELKLIESFENNPLVPTDRQAAKLILLFQKAEVNGFT